MSISIDRAEKLFLLIALELKQARIKSKNESSKQGEKRDKGEFVCLESNSSAKRKPVQRLTDTRIGIIINGQKGVTKKIPS